MKRRKYLILILIILVTLVLIIYRKSPLVRYSTFRFKMPIYNCMYKIGFFKGHFLNIMLNSYSANKDWNYEDDYLVPIAQKNPEVIDKILTFLSDDDIQWKIFYTMAKIGPNAKKAIPVMEKLLAQSDDQKMRIQIDYSIYAIDSTRTDKLYDLLNIFKTTSDGEIRHQIASYLVIWKKDKLLPIRKELLNLLNANNVNVRLYTAWIFLFIATKDDKPQIERAYQTETDPETKTHLKSTLNIISRE